MAILICFASCANNVGASEENDPEVLVSYELNGDAIKLYDNSTFVITLKDNAGTISGNYATSTSGYTLTVNKASGSLANSGDVLKLKVADKKLSVASSDIKRYSAGDSGEQTGGNSPAAPSDGQGNEGSGTGDDSNVDNSLGTPPDESKKFSEKYFTDKKSEDGIYLEFTVPAGTDQSRIYINGIGQVSEEIWRNESGNKGAFFYPFLAPNKEYTIRVEFRRAEDKDDDGFVIGHVGSDGTIGWFQTKVTAGAKSKGEVLVKEHGKLEVKDNGDFKFVKRPTFENEALLTGSGYDWMMDVALVEGVSWEHEGRKTKWGEAIEIPQKSIEETRNLYTVEYYWKNDDFSKIDFICYRPILHYKYDGKEYKYLWYSDLMDTLELKTEAEMYTSIDISKAADVAKIKGTWTYKSGWLSNNVYEVQQRKLEIGDNIVKHNESTTYTKPDGKAFANGELLDDQYKWCDAYEDSALLSEAEEFEANLKNNPKIFDFEKIKNDGEKIRIRFGGFTTILHAPATAKQ